MSVVRAHFRPEFLNRIDEIILFHRLRREDMGEIVDIQLRRLNRLLEDRKITLTLDAKARQWLAEKGYDPTYGARPLKRVIQKWVQDPLAQMLLAGEIGERRARQAQRLARAPDHQREGGRRRIGRILRSRSRRRSCRFPRPDGWRQSVAGRIDAGGGPPSLRPVTSRGPRS